MFPSDWSKCGDKGECKILNIRVQRALLLGRFGRTFGKSASVRLIYVFNAHVAACGLSI